MDAVAPNPVEALPVALKLWNQLPPAAQDWVLWISAFMLGMSFVAALVNGAERALRAEGRKPHIALVVVQGALNMAGLNPDKVYEAVKRMLEIWNLWKNGGEKK